MATEPRRLHAVWLDLPESRRLFAALGRHGKRSRFVGGAVRDALFADKPAHAGDLDVATQNRPDETMERLAEEGIRAIPTGIAHGTVTALLGDHRFEVTTLRQDVATDGRHAEVAYTDDFVLDAARRDFTFNAMSCDLSGQLFDPFGGTDDLAAGRVRFIGDPVDRIREDYLRILRFFRFFARFGRVPPEAATLAACRKERHGLARLAGERIWSELRRLLRADGAPESLALMVRAGIWSELFPVDPNLYEFSAVRQLDCGEDPVLLLAALLRGPGDGHHEPGMVAAIAERLKLSSAERQALMKLLVSDLPDEIEDEHAYRRWAYTALKGDDRLARLMLTLSWSRRRLHGDRLSSLLAAASAMPAPILPISGADMAARGVSPGPELGRLKRMVEEQWVMSNFTLDRAACLALLDEFLRGRRLDNHPPKPP